MHRNCPFTHHSQGQYLTTPVMSLRTACLLSKGMGDFAAVTKIAEQGSTPDPTMTGFQLSECPREVGSDCTAGDLELALGHLPNICPRVCHILFLAVGVWDRHTPSMAIILRKVLISFLPLSCKDSYGLHVVGLRGRCLHSEHPHKGHFKDSSLSST